MENTKPKTKEEELTKDCVLCGLEIPPEFDPKTGEPFWFGGHNPRPLKNEGRCCDVCNHTKVIPARLGMM